MGEESWACWRSWRTTCLAAVVGRWRERLTGREVETAGRGGAFGPSPHVAPPPPPATPRRAPKRKGRGGDRSTGRRNCRRCSQEQAADSRVERLAGRAEGRREAAEKAKEAVGARPIHITSQLGLVAQRRLRAKGC